MREHFNHYEKGLEKPLVSINGVKKVESIPLNEIDLVQNLLKKCPRVKSKFFKTKKKLASRGADGDEEQEVKSLESLDSFEMDIYDKKKKMLQKNSSIQTDPTLLENPPTNRVERFN